VSNLSDRGKAIIYVAIAAVLWSTAGLFIKWIPWHPVAIAGLRSGIATLVLLLYWWMNEKSLPPKPNLKKSFGALNYMLLVLLFIGANKMTTAANAILLQFTSPIWVIILAAIFLNEPFRKKDIWTTAAVLMGMGLFFVGNLEFGSMFGNFLAILSGLAMAIMVVSLKGVKVGSPLEIILWGNIFTFIVGFPFYGGIIFTQVSLAGILFLGVVQLGLSYIFFAKGIQKVSAFEGILIPVLEPLLNPIWVLLFYGEYPTIYAFVGGIIVICAVGVSSLRNA
jgi:drug/metabolite transporter (DMT)-like permease